MSVGGSTVSFLYVNVPLNKPCSFSAFTLIEVIVPVATSLPISKLSPEATEKASPLSIWQVALITFLSITLMESVLLV